MPQIAGFKPDTWRSDDLSIEADVNALARLMLSRNVAPPLSIGVFSPEGSGKTFFTQRLSQAVSEIAFRDRSRCSL